MIVSPITGKNNTKIVKEIPAKIIIEQYKRDIGIDVGRFFQNLNEIYIAECLDSGFRFYGPGNIFGDGEFYASLNKLDSGYYKPDRWEHLQALSMVDASEKILEVGSGDGSFLQMVKSKGGDITGLEINQDAITHAKKRGLTVLPEMLETHASENRGKYDVVVSFQVLEHIYDVKSYFENAISCLKPGGRLIIGVPNNNPYLFRWDTLHTLNLPPHHSGLWSKEAFTNLAKFFPLHVESIKVEPLQEYGEWYKAQKQHYLQSGQLKGFIYSVLPRPIGKMFVRLFSNYIDGRNLLVNLKTNSY